MAGYGSRPGAVGIGHKEARKNGKTNLNHYLKMKDAKGYREMLVKGAVRLASHGFYSTAASMLMLFIQQADAHDFRPADAGPLPDLLRGAHGGAQGQGARLGLKPLGHGGADGDGARREERTSMDNERMDKVVEQWEQHSLAGPSHE